MHKKSSNAFQVFLILLFSILGLMIILPFFHLIAKAFSSEAAVISGGVKFWPVGFQLDVLNFVVHNRNFLQALFNSVVVTVIGTFVSMAATTLAAYPLSKPSFRGRRGFLLLFAFSMVFYGGIVPSYLLVKSLGLLDTLWAQILPFVVIQFNLFIMKTFFEGIPESIEESARIDGAGNLTILLRIVLPISAPVLATVGLFYAVHYWNSYYHAMLFVSKPEVKPLQLYLYELINSAQNISEIVSAEQAMNVTPMGVQSATIVVSTLPILILYPFLQKYFMHGLTVGSVKG